MSPLGGSTLMTSAPKSAMMVVDTGPAMKLAASITRMPSRRRVMVGSRYPSLSSRRRPGPSPTPGRLPCARAGIHSRQRFLLQVRRPTVTRGWLAFGPEVNLRINDHHDGYLAFEFEAC